MELYKTNVAATSLLASLINFAQLSGLLECNKDPLITGHMLKYGKVPCFRVKLKSRENFHSLQKIHKVVKLLSCNFIPCGIKMGIKIMNIEKS